MRTTRTSSKIIALTLPMAVLLTLSVLKPEKKYRNRVGVGQLSLVEHALCPLKCLADENQVHSSSYQFSDAGRKRKTANVRVFAPMGLAPNDELYLWGLLNLTASQQNSSGRLVATPHWCLKHLGLIDQKTRRGGRQYRQFASALKRLSVVSYLSDAFYDPLREEYRKVSLKFFSYSLPENPKSTRAWTIEWDRVFFELVQAKGGSMRFDFEKYRGFDPASRRLFLFVLKIAYRKGRFPSMNLRDLAVNLLGLSPTLAIRDMKVKVVRTLKRLETGQVIKNVEVDRVKPGVFNVRFDRGVYLRRPSTFDQRNCQIDSPLIDGLLSIGFRLPAASRIIRKYPQRIVSLWTDVTLAALEKFGASYFRVSPMAYFTDSIQNAAKGTRTPPDWWHQFKKSEARRCQASNPNNLLFSKLITEVFGEASIANGNSSSPKNQTKNKGPEHVGDLLQKIRS